MKKYQKVISIVVGILVVIGIKFGIGFFAAEAEVAMSKNSDWSAEYKKSFITGCISEMKEEISDEAKTSLCTCLTDEIEKAHVISTKYNSFKESEQTYNERMSKEVYAYFESDAGKTSTETCAQKVFATAADPSAAPASEEKN